MHKCRVCVVWGAGEAIHAMEEEEEHLDLEATGVRLGPRLVMVVPAPMLVPQPGVGTGIPR